MRDIICIHLAKTQIHVELIFAHSKHTLMERIRLKVDQASDYSLDRFDPDTCNLHGTFIFHADLNDDLEEEKIVVQESSYVEVPRTKDQFEVAPFIRHSIVTIDVYDTTGSTAASRLPKNTTAKFSNTIMMSLDQFYNDPHGSCPPPTFRGLYLTKNADETYLEFSADSYTLNSYHSDDGTRMMRHRPADKKPAASDLGEV